MDISSVLSVVSLLELLNKLGIISTGELMELKGKIIDEMMSSE